MKGIKKEGLLIGLAQMLKNYSIDLITLQETKQIGAGIAEVGEHIFFNSGGQDKTLETDFMVNKKIKKSVSFNAITNSLCMIRLRSKYRKLSIVNMHCPTEEKNEEVKEELYEKIENDIMT